MKLRILPRLSPQWAPYVFLMPFVVLFAVFGIFTLLFSFYLAFQSWEPTSGITAMNFVGLENFAFALQDEWFWKAVGNTLWLAVATGIPQHVVAIPLAYFLQNAYKRYRNAVAGIFFLPYITSTVAIAMMFGTLFSTDYGVINLGIGLLRHVPVLNTLVPAENIDWLSHAENIKPALSIVVFWRYLGFNVVLYLAALQTIPQDIYEAATMDGAGSWQKFWFITIPSIKPMIFFCVILSVVGGLQLFEEPFILTGGRGGTDQAGMTAAMYMYRTAFEFNDLGTASALSWLLFVFVVLLTLATNWAFKDRHAKK